MAIKKFALAIKMILAVYYGHKNDASSVMWPLI